MIKEDHKWLHGFEISKGLFTDQGYRFRKNDLRKSICWFSVIPCSKYAQFYDYTYFNDDTYRINPKDTTNNDNKIAEIW